ncbi:MAG: aldo/keto reductase [Phycisphaeraceae bacterium]|nr:aldo/keto reductase [Phycisphaeraceae bacterium]
MRYRTLGSTDLDVSVIAMGCWAIAGDNVWGPQDEADAVAGIRQCLDEGINFFDTAEAYGNGESEALLGRGLAGRRDEAIIATKVSSGHLAADDLQAACEASLQRLQTDVIDLYQIHWPSRDVPIEETCGALEELKEAGKIRAIGVSNFGPQDMSELLELGSVASNQVMYNLLTRAIEFEIQPQCAEHDISILCYSPIQQGLLAGKFDRPEDVPETRARTRHFSGDRPKARHGRPGCEEELFAAVDRISVIADDLGRPMAELALAWCLHQPAVASAIVGVRNPDQARRNARAGDLELDDATLDALDEATRAVKEALGPNADLWQPAEESRIR